MGRRPHQHRAPRGGARHSLCPPRVQGRTRRAARGLRAHRQGATGMSLAVEGPIGTEHSVPYGSARREGSEEAKLLAEFEYSEAEFFVSGTANTYGPASLRSPA